MEGFGSLFLPILRVINMKWTRPTGTTIVTNDLPATIEACEKLGWKEFKEAAPKKKAAPKKEDDEKESE